MLEERARCYIPIEQRWLVRQENRERRRKGLAYILGYKREDRRVT